MIAPARPGLSTIHAVIHAIYCFYSGACTKCGHTLDKFVTLPNQLFEKLKVEVMDKALLRDDVYLNTTPEELEHFTRFLASNPPFDVIVDGMNCLYTLADGKRTAYKSSSLKV